MNITPINYQANIVNNNNTNFKASQKAIYEAFVKKFPNKIPEEYAAINLDAWSFPSGLAWGTNRGVNFVPGNERICIGELRFPGNTKTETYQIIPVKDQYRKVINYTNEGPMYGTFEYDLSGTTHQIANV